MMNYSLSLRQNLGDACQQHVRENFSSDFQPTLPKWTVGGKGEKSSMLNE